jgi:3-O-methylgallate 3,4-dioxygenase
LVHRTAPCSSPRARTGRYVDHVDCRAPIYDFEGKPRSFEELLKSPASASPKTAPRRAERISKLWKLWTGYSPPLRRRKLDVLVIVGDDQREIFGDECRPAIAVYYGDSIRNAPAPAEPTTSWYLQDQRKRMEDKHERFYPCHSSLGTYIAAGLTDQGFDITAMKSLKGEQFEGHAYSFIHRCFMPGALSPSCPSC